MYRLRTSVDRRDGDGMKLDSETSIQQEEPRWKRIMKREGMGCFISLHFRLYLLLYTQVLRLWSKHFLDTCFASAFVNSTTVASGLILHLLLVHYIYLTFRESPQDELLDDEGRLRSLNFYLLLLTDIIIFFMLIDTTILPIGLLLLPDTLPRIKISLVAGLLLTLIDILYILVSTCWRELLWWLHIGLSTWHARVCARIFNWRNACATFVKKLPIRTTNRKNDELKHFKWTCHCGRIFDETVREVVPGAVADWVDALSFRHDPDSPVSAESYEAIPISLSLVAAVRRFRSAKHFRFSLAWAALSSHVFSISHQLRPHYDHENEGSQANPYETWELAAVPFITGLALSLWIFEYKAPLVNGVANTLFDLDVITGARGDMLGEDDDRLPPQTTDPANTPLSMVTGGPIPATYTEIIGVEQGGRPPRDGNNPPLPKTEVEDGPPHSEYVLLLINHGRHRTKFFAANIQGRWTDRDTFSQIKEHYHRYKISWWYLNTLSHVEFKKFHIYHSNHVDIANREKEEVPICEQECASGCGMGCLGYWYTPPRAKMIPPIPRKAMLHFLESPDCLGTGKCNRAVLPKRRDTLKLGDLHLREGWGLRFKEKVWSLPIVTVQFLSIISAIVVTVCWTLPHEKSTGSLVPGVFILLIGQSIAALLQRWAESNLDEEPKA